jgi:putative colanic acid biosynthesis glycosyltransferase
MKIIQINSVCGTGSTGRIVQNISEKLSLLKIENYIFYGVGKSNYPLSVKFGNTLNVMMHQIGTRLFGKHAFYSKFATHQLVRKLSKLKPSIIHLHNLHGHYLNIKILFNYLKKTDIKVFWTLHDCWAYTGHCAYYDFVKCDKWKEGCGKCPALRQYPVSLVFDRSSESYKDKKEIFNSLTNLIFITPSNWLASNLKQSFLNKYQVNIVNNGIDLGLFFPSKSKLKDLYHIENKFIILGVASVWDQRKGLDYFIQLSRKISENDVIILVGVTPAVIEKLPNNIIGVTKTNSIKELAEYYSMADVFVNPTLEDNFPTTNLESLACGTPVITFNTGGSPESIDNETGIVVKKGDTEGLLKAINIIKNNTKNYYSENCTKRAKLNYNKEHKYDEYIKLYLEVKAKN